MTNKYIFKKHQTNQNLNDDIFCIYKLKNAIWGHGGILY